MIPSYGHADDHLSAMSRLVGAPLNAPAGLFVGQSILISGVSAISNSNPQSIHSKTSRPKEI
jgi:hypothetical protein